MTIEEYIEYVKHSGTPHVSTLERYCEDVLSGRITGCKKLKLTCKKLLHDIHHPGKYHFDEEIANRHVEFIMRFCKTPAGKLGAPLYLQPYQIAQLQSVFGFVDDDGVRQYNEVLIIEGRKNGKTSLLSAILIDMLLNDHEGAPQCVTAATAKDQAKLAFDAALKMVRKSPQLAKHIFKRAYDLYSPINEGTIKALSSNTNSLDGLDLSCCVIDELSAIRDRDTYDLLKQAMSARLQPLLFCITTSGFVRGNIFDAQYEYAKNILEGNAENEHFLCWIYELDDPTEWLNESCWIKANPGLGTIKSLDYLRQMVQKAHDDPTFKPTVMVKDFNVPQTSEAAWLRYEDLNNENTFDIGAFDYAIGSFDAADTTDLNAAKVLCARPGDDKLYFKSMYWIPESVIDDQNRRGDRKERDDVPYSLWVDLGYMRTCPGNKCDKRIFLEWFKELREAYDLYVTKIFYDPWHIDDTLLREFKGEFGANSMIPVRQGAPSLSEPMKAMAADFKAHNIVYNNNPIDKWCLYNTQTKSDVNGNIQPVKSLDPRKRIDGAVTFIMAYKGFMDTKDQYINLNKELDDGTF